MIKASRLAIGAIALVGCVMVTHPAHAEPAPPPYRGCVVYEDQSYICGTLMPVPGSEDLDSPTWDEVTVDRTLPYIAGCIPSEDPDPACVEQPIDS